MLQSSDIKFHIAGRLTVVHVNDYQIDEENHKAPKCESPSKKSSLPLFIIRPLYFFFFLKEGWLWLSSVWSACRLNGGVITQGCLWGANELLSGLLFQNSLCWARASKALQGFFSQWERVFWMYRFIFSKEEILGYNVYRFIEKKLVFTVWNVKGRATQ